VAKKNPKNNERRAMVEKMRADQARKERTRSLGILGVCILIVAALVGTAGYKAFQDNQAKKDRAAKAITELGVAQTAAGCDPIKTTPTDHNQTHVPTAPIAYKDAPPAFGPHRPQPAAFGRPFYSDDRPEVATLVHNEEHGFTIAWYDDTAAKDKSEMDNLKTIAQKYQDSNQKFIAAPWHTSDGAAFPDGKHIALTRWTADPSKPSDESKQAGNWQYCGQVSGTVINDFFKKWPEDTAPENIPVS
jgi:hypothetical protein